MEPIDDEDIQLTNNTPSTGGSDAEDNKHFPESYSSDASASFSTVVHPKRTLFMA